MGWLMRGAKRAPRERWVVKVGLGLILLLFVAPVLAVVISRLL